MCTLTKLCNAFNHNRYKPDFLNAICLLRHTIFSHFLNGKRSESLSIVEVKYKMYHLKFRYLDKMLSRECVLTGKVKNTLTAAMRIELRTLMLLASRSTT